MSEHNPAIDSVLEQLRGREVVIDAASPFVYLGTLAGYNHKYLVLEQADAHDLRDTQTNRENYIVESRRHGVRHNRDKIYVRQAEVVSISALADVVV